MMRLSKKHDRTCGSALPVDTLNNIGCAQVTGFSQFLPVMVACWDTDEDGFKDEACGGGRLQRQRSTRESRCNGELHERD